LVFASIFSIIVGTAIIGQWTVSFIKKQIPGPEAGAVIGRGAVEMGFHYTAEFLTAAVLIAAGIGLLVEGAWGPTVYYVGTGMLIYTAINSSGYFAQQRQGAMVGMFAVLIILALINLNIVA
jgi:hypothetical protein